MFRSYNYKLIFLLGSILVGVYTPAVAECDSMGDVIVAKSMQLDDKESIEFLEKMYTDSVHSYSKETRLCILNTLKSHYTNSGLLQKQFDTELRILETLVFYDRVEAQIRITQSEKLYETLSANKLFDRKKAMGGLLTQKAILKFYEKEFDAAININRQAISVLKKSNDTLRLVDAYFQSGRFGQVQHAYGIHNLDKMYTAWAMLDSAEQLAQQCNLSLGMILVTKSKLLMRFPKDSMPVAMSRAVDYASRSYKIHLKENHSYGLSRSLNAFMDILTISPKDTALHNKIFSQESIGDIEGLLSKAYTTSERLGSERAHLSTISRIFQMLSVMKDESGSAYGELYRYYSSLNARDRLTRAEKALNIQFNLKEARLNNQLLEARERQRKIITIVVIVLLLLIVSFLSYLSWISNKKNRIITSQNKKLQKLDSLKDRFLVNVSHEFRTPLTLIQGPLSQLLELESLGTQAKNLVKISLKNSQKLGERVDEILDIASLENGNISLDKSTTLLVPFMRRVISNFESLAASNHIVILEKVLIDQYEKVNIDRSKLEKVINNLMSNAIKHSPSGSKIDIEIKKVDGKYMFTVSDEGVGIPESDLEKIFDRFYQVKTPNAEGGTGVGLALSMQIAKLMHGNIVASNRAESGVSFKFTFLAEPSLNREELFESDQEFLEASYSPVNNVAFGSRPTVLVVEDHLDMRNYITNILLEKFQVYQASNGAKGMRILETQAVDLIISDVMMPEKDGFEFLREIKEDLELKKIPIIFLTARSKESDKLDAFRLGVDDYIVKPFLPKELLARISSLVNNLMERTSSDKEENDVVSYDEATLMNIQKAIKTNIDKNFTVDELAEEVFMSRRTLHRLIKSTIGVTPANYIKEYKLNYARELLMKKKYRTVKEVAQAVGFRRADYLAKAYVARFGRKPSDYF